MKTLSIIFLLTVHSSFTLSQTPDSADYFPVHSGDVRQYHSEITGEVVSTIYTDSVKVDSLSKTTFAFESSGLEWKIDSLGNVYDMMWQSTYVHYKLNADSGDSWQAGVFNDSAVIASVVFVASTNVFGINTTVKAIRFTVQESPPPQQPFSFGTDYLAKGFGLVESQVEPSDVYFLTGAVINRVKYGVITSVNHGISIPQAIDVIENYPNPFNNGTRFFYTIANNGYVNLTLYDMLGRNVKTLVNGSKLKGTYESYLYADGMSSGTYFAVLSTNSRILIHKILLLK